MKAQHTNRKLGEVLVFLLVLLALIAGWPILNRGAFSTTLGRDKSTLPSSQSASYKITADILAEGGEAGSSASYGLFDVIGNAIEGGEAESTSFRLFSGLIPDLYPGGPPPNENSIIYPPDGLITIAPSVTVTGATTAGAFVAIHLGTGVYTTTAGSAGDYAVSGVGLTPGPNTIESLSTDIYGNRARASVAITRTTYFLTGTLLSRIHDAGQQVTWETITWQADTPAGTSIVFHTRTGNSPTPDDTWSDWSEEYTASGQTISSPSNRYIQYRALLSTADGLASPVLKEVTIHYSAGVSTPSVVSWDLPPSPVDVGQPVAFGATVNNPVDRSVSGTLRLVKAEGTVLASQGITVANGVHNVSATWVPTDVDVGTYSVHVEVEFEGGVLFTSDPISLTVNSTPSGGSRLYLGPGSTSVMVGQVFTVALKADTGADTADTVDAYIDFDPTYLEVVDESGVPATAIDLNTEVFSNAIVNSVDNTAGQIDFSATRFGSPLSGIFTAATIRLRAKAAVDTTSLSFVRSEARFSDLYQSGESLAASLDGAIVHIRSVPVLYGRVALERRGAAGDPRWITELFRVDGNMTSGGIEVYETGTANLLGTFSATTDVNGRFSVELTGIAAGSYDISVKGSNTLSNERTNINVPQATEIDFGTLRVGDSNGDNRVNGADVSYMVPSFLRCSGDDGFRPYADTNKDRCINGADVSALVPNFLESGDDVGTMRISPATKQLTNEASLALSSSTSSVGPGGLITMDIVADTGTSAADTVDAYIDFDPTYLEVVDASGTPATSIELNTDVFANATFNVVDNATGRIDFSATKFDTPLSGAFSAATIRFRAKATTDTTEITFVRTGARWSDLYLAGESINPTITNGTVRVICPDFAEPPGVDAGDIQFVAARWRQAATGQPYDFDGDGIVTVLDVMRVAVAWGSTCSQNK